MKYKAIIFDMDGTIIDSEHIWRKVTRDLIVSKGVDPTHELLEHFETNLKGLATHASCAFIKKELELHHTIEELMLEKHQRAIDLFNKQINFIDGFKAFHKRALEKNLKVGIATNADDNTLQKTKDKLNLHSFFGEHIYNITHVNNKHKPAPDLYLHTAEKLQLDPKECVAIEDSGHGIKAAVDAGMFCIGINTSKNRDLLHEAHLIIDHYDDICLKRLLKLKEA